MTLESSGNSWLIGPSSPKVAITAVAPSSTGTTAATSAPNAISSTSSVTGRDNFSARLRSLLPFPLLLSSSTAMIRGLPAEATAALSASVENGEPIRPLTRAECPPADMLVVT